MWNYTYRDVLHVPGLPPNRPRDISEADRPPNSFMTKEIPNKENIKETKHQGKEEQGEASRAPWLPNC